MCGKGKLPNLPLLSYCIVKLEMLRSSSNSDATLSIILNIFGIYYGQHTKSGKGEEFPFDDLSFML